MRDSNIELLRIVSMVLIIMHHFSVHGCFPFTSDLTFASLWVGRKGWCSGLCHDNRVFHDFQ